MTEFIDGANSIEYWMFRLKNKIYNVNMNTEDDEEIRIRWATQLCMKILYVKLCRLIWRLKYVSKTFNNLLNALQNYWTLWWANIHSSSSISRSIWHLTNISGSLSLYPFFTDGIISIVSQFCFIKQMKRMKMWFIYEFWR